MSLGVCDGNISPVPNTYWRLIWHKYGASRYEHRYERTYYANTNATQMSKNTVCSGTCAVRTSIQCPDCLIVTSRHLTAPDAKWAWTLTCLIVIYRVLWWETGLTRQKSRAFLFRSDIEMMGWEGRKVDCRRRSDPEQTEHHFPHYNQHLIWIIFNGTAMILWQRYYHGKTGWRLMIVPKTMRKKWLASSQNKQVCSRLISF